MGARLHKAASLPAILAAGFDTFEAIRGVARAYEDAAPELFAAFMTAADAAVGGRDALMFAPSLPDDGMQSDPAGPAAGHPVDEVTDALAGLGALLHQRLTQATALATAPDDRSACEEAAKAAERVHHLMARDDHDGNVW